MYINAITLVMFHISLFGLVFTCITFNSLGRNLKESSIPLFRLSVYSHICIDYTSRLARVHWCNTLFKFFSPLVADLYLYFDFGLFQHAKILTGTWSLSIIQIVQNIICMYRYTVCYIKLQLLFWYTRGDRSHSQIHKVEYQ